MGRLLAALIASCLMVGPSVAFGETGWRSETHLGLARHDQSTTRFQDASGSLVFLDITHLLSESISLGMRTTMMGAERQSQKFYRLAAGPVLAWEWSEYWSLAASFGYFRESAQGAQKEALYESRGLLTTLGWQRIVPLTPRAAFIWGAFVALHEGTARNKGRARGAEIALRVAL